MVELVHDTLIFSFPECHRDAVLRVELQRTVRLPEHDLPHPLPALGRLPMRPVNQIPESMAASIARDGVVVPLHAEDAMWLEFTSPWDYPFAVQLAAGRRDALTGATWRDRLSREPQNYLVVPIQRKLTGWRREDRVRQFTADEGNASAASSPGALQLVVQPLRQEARDEWVRSGESASPVCYADAVNDAGGRVMVDVDLLDDPFEESDWEHQERCRCLLYAVIMNPGRRDSA